MIIPVILMDLKLEPCINRIKLGEWFEIDEQQYLLYILRGYEIDVTEISVSWRLNGLWHREDGPAYIGADGTQDWYLNGQRHREDGPAYIKADGTKQWYLNGKQMTEHEWRHHVDKMNDISLVPN